MPADTPTPAVPLDQVAAMNARALGAAAEANARMLRSMLGMQAQVMEFVRRRLSHDVETVHALAECRDAPQAITLAQSFCARAMADYAEESAEIMRASVALGAEAANGMQNGADNRAA